RRYLQSRGIDDATAAAFELGYAPREPDILMRALREAGIDEEIAEEAGLLAGKKGRGLFLRFRHRLMFPIRDARGQVVGFGGRKLADDDWGPKYLNSPQSAIFNKRAVLFGLWEARDALRKLGVALLVEGYI